MSPSPPPPTPPLPWRHGGGIFLSRSPSISLSLFLAFLLGEEADDPIGSPAGETPSEAEAGSRPPPGAG